MYYSPRMSSLDSPSFYLIVAGIFVLAGFVKGIVSIGLPTVVMGLLGAVMPPAQAASLMVIPAIATNVWQIAAGPRFVAVLRRLWTMLAGTCIGTWIASGFLTGGSAEQTRLVLGIVLAVYGCTGFTRLQLSVPARVETWLAPVIGIATGLLTGATGVFVIPAIPYIQALGLDKEAFIQAVALSALVSALALAASLALGGVLGVSLAGASLLAMVPALGGMYFGQWLRLRTSEAMFRKIFFAAMIALGVYLAARNLG
jgi:uncharacterized membrane protein YfcA